MDLRDLRRMLREEEAAVSQQTDDLTVMIDGTRARFESLPGETDELLIAQLELLGKFARRQAAMQQRQNTLGQTVVILLEEVAKLKGQPFD